MDELKKKLASIIIEKSFRYSPEQPFTLASGKQSDYYFNCKPTTLDPEGMNLIGGILFAMVEDADLTACGGLTLGADPIAIALSMISFQKGKPIKSFVVRKEAKGHGTKSAIEGGVQTGEKVLIIDDVITTGGSTIMAIERAREAGLLVAQVVVLIDREEGGKAEIEKLGVEVRAMLTRSEIMDIYKGKKGRPSPSDL
ncbi:MAG: orotate phosphoribosyltransferase [Deltaproteobacteria bacterium]|nr:orotate phosphoribosyltransferase [Deltaproteobacteria bacterium]